MGGDGYLWDGRMHVGGYMIMIVGDNVRVDGLR